MRQLILTDFTQKTSLANKTATAYLEFNNGELAIPISQDALVEVVKFISQEKDDSEQNFSSNRNYPTDDLEYNFSSGRNYSEGASQLTNQSPPQQYFNQLSNPISTPYDESLGGVVDEDGIEMF